MESKCSKEPHPRLLWWSPISQYGTPSFGNRGSESPRWKIVLTDDVQCQLRKAASQSSGWNFWISAIICRSHIQDNMWTSLLWTSCAMPCLCNHCVFYGNKLMCTANLCASALCVIRQVQAGTLIAVKTPNLRKRITFACVFQGLVLHAHLYWW